ncbi:MAG: hypothetical protein D6744_06765 [Planctomycetota bacterium]|nr:MAG: hypothetical protein D6744_06765 [Planctomycetota bacterium]
MKPNSALVVRGVIAAAVVATLGLLVAARPDDDVTDRLDRVESRVQALEDALGLALRDRNDRPLARRIEKLEQSMTTLSQQQRGNSGPGASRSGASAAADVRRQLARLETTLREIESDVRRTRDVAGDLRRLSDALSDLRRELSRLESRVDRLERD